jgi:hypothetical protein
VQPCNPTPRGKTTLLRGGGFGYHGHPETSGASTALGVCGRLADEVFAAVDEVGLCTLNQVDP